MTKTDSYFVNLGHALIDYLLKDLGDQRELKETNTILKKYI
jgi:hypothetical protein